MNWTSYPKDVFKSLSIRLFLIVGITFFGIKPNLQAQCQTHCSISCYPNVNINLSAGTCQALILPSTVSNAIMPSCNSEYVVVLKDEDGKVIPGSVLTTAHVGKEITFHLSNIVLNCENFCWGRLTVENKNLPTIMSSKVEGMCGAKELTFTSLEYIQEVLDASCSSPVSNLSESIETFGDKCSEQVTVRTVSGTVELDGIQHVTVSIDTAILTKLDTMMVTCPGSSIFDEALVIDCEATDEYPTPEVIAKLYKETLAYPYIHKGKIETERDTFVVLDSIRETTVETKIEISPGLWALFPVVTKTPVYKDSIATDSTDLYIPIKTGTQECNLTTKYSDQTYVGCTGEKSKILRTWTILDWCTGGIKTCEQWIVIRDETAPWIKIPRNNVMVNVTPWTCKASVDLTGLFEVIGGCSEAKYDLRSSGGSLNGNVLSELWLSEDPVKISIEAYNGCGKSRTDTLTILVKDMSAPVVIANDQVQVTLTGDPYNTEIGVGKVLVDEIDRGSHDSGCGEIEKCVLLDVELQDPIIIKNVHVTDSLGNLLYRQHQCGEPDGIYEIFSIFKGEKTVLEEIPYVICKEYVKVCCENIPQAKVALVVSDESPYSPDGYSWSDIVVEDKSIPIMQCQDVELECGYDYGPDVIGWPTIYHPICNQEELTYVDDKDLDACGNGAILRMWFYGDESLCVQRITFRIEDAFDPMKIKWPKHYDDDYVDGYRRECEILKDLDGDIIYDFQYDDHGGVIGKTPRKGIIQYPESIPMGGAFECSVSMGTGAPVWCNETCGLLASSYEDEEVEAGEACKKIIRKWTIIDWCLWKPNGNNIDDENDTSRESFEVINDEWLTDPDCKECEKESGIADDVYLRYRDGAFDRDGYYTYDQVIKIVDFTAPAIDVATRDTVHISTGALSKNDTYEDCINEGTVTATSLDVCGLDQVIESDKITWSIVTKDETGKVIAGPKQVIGASATMTTGIGAAGTFHEIIWKATDGCGNSTTTYTIVDFADTKKPTPVCLQDLSTSSMSTDGSAQIWAEDFDNGSYDNCGDIKFAFLLDDNGDVTTDAESGSFLPSVSFDCDDLTAGFGATINLEMYVIDNYGNYEYCNVRLRIDDNEDSCPDGNIEAALIAGALYTSSGDMVEEVAVELNDNKSMTTSLDGKYGFNNSALGENYKVTPSKDGDDLNGVTILDVYIIAKHVLGIGALETPYELIAADINNDQQVSSLDMVELRKVILGINSEFINNTSWRFVDADQTFENESKPWPFLESINIEDLKINMREENFIAVKIGDLNGSAIANSALLSKGRSSNKLELVASDKKVQTGETFEVVVSAQAVTDLLAFQFTLHHEGAELIGIEGNELKLNTDDYAQISSDLTSLSWYNKNGAIELQENKEMYTLKFKATTDLTVSNALEINSAVTESIAYNKELESMDIELAFAAQELVFSLEQNHPNPFDQQTDISFTLPEAGEATLSVFDATGKVLALVTDNYKIGRNSVKISRNQLGGSSAIIYYQLESKDHIATRKMIMLQN